MSEFDYESSTYAYNVTKVNVVQNSHLPPFPRFKILIILDVKSKFETG